MPHIITAPEIRFTRFFDATDGKCWLWKGHIIKSGYGQFCPAKGVADGAHRYSYKIYKGEIPEGMFVCHRCNMKTCVNPEHLYLATPLQNTRDAQRDGLLGKALNKEKVLEIRRLKNYEGWTDQKIANHFDVTRHMVRCVITHKNWTHV